MFLLQTSSIIPNCIFLLSLTFLCVVAAAVVVVVAVVVVIIVCCCSLEGSAGLGLKKQERFFV